MPTYEFRCPKCSKEFDVVMRMSELDESVVTCTQCSVSAVQHFRTACNVAIPQNHQAAPNMDKSEKARVPINIIDEKPDGGYKVTRIGRKEDIHND